MEREYLAEELPPSSKSPRANHFLLRESAASTSILIRKYFTKQLRRQWSHLRATRGPLDGKMKVVLWPIAMNFKIVLILKTINRHLNYQFGKEIAFVSKLKYLSK